MRAKLSVNVLGYNDLSADSVALMSDCAHAQADLSPHCPNVTLCQIKPKADEGSTPFVDRTFFVR